MKKYETIKKKEDFSNLIKNAKYFKTPEFIIYYSENEINYRRFGIAISKKIGNAVTRNKLKRQTRNIIDNLKTMFKNNTDYIIMIRKGCLSSSFSTKLENLRNVLKEN